MVRVDSKARQGTASRSGGYDISEWLRNVVVLAIPQVLSLPQ